MTSEETQTESCYGEIDEPLNDWSMAIPYRSSSKKSQRSGKSDKDSSSNVYANEYAWDGGRKEGKRTSEGGSTSRMNGTDGNSEEDEETFFNLCSEHEPTLL
jgi:hypothetical protein